jgi:pimeloyl-ACP methyl ester carboxylesterase
MMEYGSTLYLFYETFSRDFKLNFVLYPDVESDLRACTEQHARGPVILVASSLGCWISTIVAQRHPERIQGTC